MNFPTNMVKNCNPQETIYESNYQNKPKQLNTMHTYYEFLYNYIYRHVLLQIYNTFIYKLADKWPVKAGSQYIA